MAVCPKWDYISSPEAHVSRLMRMESAVGEAFAARSVCAVAVEEQGRQVNRDNKKTKYCFMDANLRKIFGISG